MITRRQTLQLLGTAAATATLAALQGGLLLAQVERDVAPLEAALDMALANVRHYAAK